MERPMSGAKAECEALMNSVLPFAKQMLDRHGEFYPYGAAMRANGEIVSVAGYEGHEHPQSNDVIRFLKAAFTAAAKNGQYKATALVYDVRATVPSTGEKSDAIAVSLNHRDGYSIVVLFPYKVMNGLAETDTPFAQKGEADIFPVQ